MRRDFFQHLQCPYSGSAMSLVDATLEQDGRVLYGVAASEAGEFPVVDGILRLQVDELRAPLIVSVRGHRYPEALRLALDWPYHTRFTQALTLFERSAIRAQGVTRFSRSLGWFKRPLESALRRAPESFCRFLDELSAPEAWREWQKFRFSMATFLPIYPLLSALKTDGPVLDVACGLGHASFLISRSANERNIVCADNSLASLSVARRYFVPQAEFVCLDGNMLLPFRAGMFSGVLCSDAFHFVTQRQSLAHEMQRVCAPAGSIVLAHLHNRHSPVRSGSSLSPAGYQHLFQDIALRVLPDKSIIEEFLRDGALDLEKHWSEDELRTSFDGVSLVASRDPAVFRRYDRAFDAFLANVRNPVINPIYRRSRQGQGTVLQKCVSSAYQEQVESRIRNYAIDAYRLEDSALSGTATAPGTPSAELIRRFVMVDAPKAYPYPGG